MTRLKAKQNIRYLYLYWYEDNALYYMQIKEKVHIVFHMQGHVICVVSTVASFVFTKELQQQQVWLSKDLHICMILWKDITPNCWYN